MEITITIILRGRGSPEPIECSWGAAGSAILPPAGRSTGSLGGIPIATAIVWVFTREFEWRESVGAGTWVAFGGIAISAFTKLLLCIFATSNVCIVRAIVPFTSSAG